MTIVRPGYRHGKVCGRVARMLGDFVQRHDLGEVIGNAAGVVTERNADTVRGPDVAYDNYSRVPRESEPVGYPSAAPEVVFEVLSPHDRWPDMLAKAGEYLAAGVLVVCVLEPEQRKLTACRTDGYPMVLTADAECELPELRGEFRVPVQNFVG